MILLKKRVANLPIRDFPFKVATMDIQKILHILSFCV